ncbi:MAG: hypothetical protein AB7K68_02295 [Bacteriovoracia bacterium]
MKLSIAACFFFLIAATVAFAADGDKPKPNIVYKKKSSVSFDDAVVEGSADNPEGIYVVTPPEKQFGSLLKLRPNFHRELMRDSLLLK